jgi:hypothetical protein
MHSGTDLGLAYLRQIRHGDKLRINGTEGKSRSIGDLMRTLRKPDINNLPLMSLAERLKWCRKVKQKTLREVETATGVSNAYISQLENGRITDPGVKRLSFLAKYYGVTLDDLLGS